MKAEEGDVRAGPSRNQPLFLRQFFISLSNFKNFLYNWIS
jgi:hypothetical protein